MDSASLQTSVTPTRLSRFSLSERVLSTAKSVPSGDGAAVPSRPLTTKPLETRASHEVLKRAETSPPRRHRLKGLTPSKSTSSLPAAPARVFDAALANAVLRLDGERYRETTTTRRRPFLFENASRTPPKNIIAAAAAASASDALSPLVGPAKIMRRLPDRLPSRVGGFNTTLPALSAVSAPSPSTSICCMCAADAPSAAQVQLSPPVRRASGRETKLTYSQAPVHGALPGWIAPPRSPRSANEMMSPTGPLSQTQSESHQSAASPDVPRAARTDWTRGAPSPSNVTAEELVTGSPSISPTGMSPTGLSPGSSMGSSPLALRQGGDRRVSNAASRMRRPSDAVGGGNKRSSKAGQRRRSVVRSLLEVVGPFPINRWQRAVVTTGFQLMLVRRVALLKRLRAVLSVGFVPLERKLAVLSPLPLCSNLTHREKVKLASMMHLKLVGRYSKVLRAGVAPPAFYVVLWGSLRYAGVGSDGEAEHVKVGGTFGEGALAAIEAMIERDEAEAAAAEAAAEEARRRGLDDDDESASEASPRAKSPTNVSSEAIEQQVPLEPSDLQAAEPTMLLYLRLADMSPLDRPWFASLQRRYLESALKTAMLLDNAFFSAGGRQLCSEIAACFPTLEKVPQGTTLYEQDIGRLDCAYLLIRGSVQLKRQLPPTQVGLRPPPPKIVNRENTSECPWAGEGALFSSVVTPDARRDHSAITTSACQFLILSRANFLQFEQVAPMLMKALKYSHEELFDALPPPPPPPPPHLREALDLTFAKRLAGPGKRDERQKFISSLVPAYAGPVAESKYAMFGGVP